MKNGDQIKRKLSDKELHQRRTAALKTGKHSKYFSKEVAEFIKDPTLLSALMLDTIAKLKQADLSHKERIAYANTLATIYRTIFGSKTFIASVNIHKKVDSAESVQQIYEIVQRQKIQRDEEKEEKEEDDEDED